MQYNLNFCFPAYSLYNMGFKVPKKSKACKSMIYRLCQVLSGRQDLNLRLHAPQTCALPGCATSRIINYRVANIVTLRFEPLTF